MSANPDRSALLRQKLTVMRQQVESLDQEIQQSLGAAAQAAGSNAATQLVGVRDGLQQILRAPSASTVLNLLLTFAARQGRRAILFILRKDELWAWSGMGPSGNKLSLNRFMISAADSPTLFSALRTQQAQRAAAAEEWLQRLAEPAEGGAAAIPLPGGERSAGILWFEAGEPRPPGAQEAVECLVAGAGAALELIAQKRPGAVAAGARVTADERALAAQLPYSIEEPGSAAAPPPVASAPGTDLGRQHEDARRLARLLVSEIKLYNEDRVVMGRKSRDLYHRLREDIERSRQVYSERVTPEVKAAADYFQQELVTILAEGDASLLGAVPAAT